MQDGNQRKSTENKWSESTIGGRFATPFSEEELGVPFGLPSRISRLAEMPWHGCYEMHLASEKKSEQVTLAEFCSYIGRRDEAGPQSRVVCMLCVPGVLLKTM